MLSLAEFAAREAYGQSVAKSPYGPVSPKHDETTGLSLIQLPDGFRYWSYSWTGDLMTDGVACPNLHDGMAAIGEWHGNDDESVAMAAAKLILTSTITTSLVTTATAGARPIAAAHRIAWCWCGTTKERAARHT